MLPTPLRWTKKLLAILKSNLSPNQIAFAVSLGVFAGLPPMGLHIILPATLALLVRCSFRAFLLSMGLFKLLSLALAPAAFAVGKWLLDSSRGLDALWRWLFHLPVLAPMGYERYLLLGSLVLSVVLAIPVFFLVRWAVVRYRDSFTSWVRGWRLSEKLRGKKGTALARRFLAGGEAKYETQSPPRGIFRFIRREMLVGIPILYAIAYLVAAVIVPFFAGNLLTSTASWVVGSEIQAEDSSFSLFTGTLTLDDFTIQDPKNPEQNLAEIPEIVFDAAMLPLLSKRVVFDRIAISDASLHVVREDDGTLNIDNVSSGWNAEGYVEWAAEHAKDVDWIGLFRKFIEYLGQVQPLPPREDPYAAFQGGRSFEAFRPPFAVRRLEIGQIDIRLTDHLEMGSLLPPITLLQVQIGNLAFPASLRERPVEIRFRGEFADDASSGFELAALLDDTGAQALHTFTLGLSRIDLVRLTSAYATTLPLRIDSGRATLTGDLQIAGDAVTGNVSLLLEEFRCEIIPGKPLFGLSVAVSQRVVDGLNRYAEELPIVLGFPIGGTREAPQPEWEASLLAVAQEGLMMLGRRELEGTIEQLGLRIEALGGVPQAVLAEDYEAIQAQAEAAARNMIADVVENAVPFALPNAQTPSETAEPAEAITNLLERLFQNAGQEPGNTSSE